MGGTTAIFSTVVNIGTAFHSLPAVHSPSPCPDVLAQQAEAQQLGSLTAQEPHEQPWCWGALALHWAHALLLGIAHALL